MYNILQHLHVQKVYQASSWLFNFKRRLEMIYEREISKNVHELISEKIHKSNY